MPGSPPTSAASRAPRPRGGRGAAPGRAGRPTRQLRREGGLSFAAQGGGGGSCPRKRRRQVLIPPGSALGKRPLSPLEAASGEEGRRRCGPRCPQEVRPLHMPRAQPLGLSLPALRSGEAGRAVPPLGQPSPGQPSSSLPPPPPALLPFPPSRRPSLSPSRRPGLAWPVSRSPEPRCGSRGQRGPRSTGRPAVLVRGRAPCPAPRRAASLAAGRRRRSVGAARPKRWAASWLWRSQVSPGSGRGGEGSGPGPPAPAVTLRPFCRSPLLQAGRPPSGGSTRSSPSAAPRAPSFSPECPSAPGWRGPRDTPPAPR